MRGTKPGAAAAPATALQMLEDMVHRFQLRPDTMAFNTALSTVAETSWQLALDLFASVHSRQLQPDVITFATIVGSCSNALMWQQAVSIFSQAPLPDAQLFGLGMRCLRWRKALLLAEGLLEEGLRSNVVLLGSVLSAWSRGFQWDHALKLLAERGVQNNIITYTAASSAMEKAQHWRWALELFLNAGAHGLRFNVQSFSCLQSACAEHGQWTMAVAIMKIMSDYSVTGNDACKNALELLPSVFTLGESFTRWVCDSKYEAFLASARLNARRGSTSIHVIDEPLATALATWLAASFATPSRLVGHGGSGLDGTPLQPVLVEHERLWHAERHSLLLILSQT
eukprot:g13546.t1